MKTKLFLFCLVMAFLACSQEKMNFSKLQDRNGLFYLVNEDKPFSGEVISYINGKTDFEGEIDNGLREGIWTQYYPNGQKKMEGAYKEGVKDGNWVYWQENGQQGKTEVYKYGKLLSNDGSVADTAGNNGQDTARVERTVVSHPTQPAAKDPVKEVEKKHEPTPVVWESLHGGPVKYLNGIAYTGPVIKYFKDGKTELEGYFVAGKRSGKWTYYTPYGTVKNVRYY